MIGRNTKVDNNDHEWMTISQYVRAVEEDFEIKISNSLLSGALKNDEIKKIYRKKVVGKNCINYTCTIAEFFKTHPLIAPSNLKKTISDWKKTLTKKAQKSINVSSLPATTAISKSENINDNLNSLAEEKAALEKLKREKLQFEFDLMKGNYIAIDELEPLLSTLAIAVRQRLEAMVPRVNPLVTACTDLHANRQLLEEEVKIASDMLEDIPSLIDGSYIDDEIARQQKEADDET